MIYYGTDKKERFRMGTPAGRDASGSEQTLIERKQRFVNFKDIIITAFDEIGDDNIEFAGT